MTTKGHDGNPDLQRHRSKRKRVGRRGGDALTGHPAMFVATPAIELGRMPEGGGYPVGFLDFAGQCLGVTDPHAVVHLCSGSVMATRTFDLRAESMARCRADVRFLPIRDESVRWVMADPPYDPDYAEALWGLGKQYPTPAAIFREVERILAPGGLCAFLHHVVPELPPQLIRRDVYGVSTGVGYRMRALTIAAKRQEGLFS